MDNFKKPIIVVDLTLSEYSNDRLFNPAIANGPGLSLWPIFARIAELNGYRVMTLDSFIKTTYDYSQAIGISYEGKKDTIKCFNKNNIRCSLVWSGESPQNARNFYCNINHRIKRFDNALLFSGTHKYCNSPKTNLHRFYWPNDFPITMGMDWNKRRLLLMVSSAKSNKAVNYSRLLSRIIKNPRHLIYSLIYEKCEVLKYPDLYESRLKLVTNLASSPNFFLLGRYWEAAQKYDDRIKKINFFNEPSECGNKFNEIGKYKFTICFENTSFPGYITEKIFDAMLGGSVPIYLGCPDIASEIPSNCFIDANSFHNPSELLEYLTNMQLFEWNNYRQNIISFLNSDQYKPYTSEYVSYQILKIITNGKIDFK